MRRFLRRIVSSGWQTTALRSQHTPYSRMATHTRNGLLFGAASISFAWDHRQTKTDSANPSVSEQRILEVLLAAAAHNLLEYADSSDSFWDEKQLHRARSGDAVTVFAKQIPNRTTRLFMGRCVLKDMKLEEFVLSCESGPGTRRASWDTSVERSESLLSFETNAMQPIAIGAPPPLVSLTRTFTLPALLGLISRRVVDDVGVSFCVLPGSSSERQRYAHFGIGVCSPNVDSILESSDVGVMQGADVFVGRLREHSRVSGGTSHVVMVNHAAGVCVEELESNVLLVNYVIHSDACGGVPAWACEKGIVQALVDIFKNVRKDVELQRRLPLAERLEGRSRWPVP
eukprot:TRINITY_DN2679_c0_g6_i1.p1 TRINITY_DN2679_c0_g6~~TRINITY_DN2679_c0_g6_i1.p1  ORF type:complete len:343 (-),score=22.83 TRINITY_DN2679_c0_g6_i1:193-1221(-)